MALNLGTMLTGMWAGTPPEMQTIQAAAGKAKVGWGVVSGGGGGWEAVSQEAMASLHSGQQGSPFLGRGSYRLWRVHLYHLTAAP